MFTDAFLYLKWTIFTYESKYTLCECQYARIKQEAEAVGPMFQRQHVYHGQKEACLRNSTKTWARWVFIGDCLQRNRLYTWFTTSWDKLVSVCNIFNDITLV